jgi:type VI protein secretion system component Hcp
MGKEATMDAKITLKMDGLGAPAGIPIVSYAQNVYADHHGDLNQGSVDFTLGKLMDRTSPLLARAAGKGLHFPLATLEILEDSGARMEIRFKDAVIVGWTLSCSSQAGAQSTFENLSLRAATAEWTFEDASGTVKGAWDPREPATSLRKTG